MIKTRLATGEMADIFQYNSGSLFQALRPTQTLADLSGPAGRRRTSRTSSSRSSPPTARSTACPSRRPWAAASSTTPRSTTSSGSRSRRPGTSSWPTTRRSRRPARCRSRRPTATPGPRSSSCWPTSTTCWPRCRPSPTTTPPTRRSTRRRPAAVRGFEHLEDAFKAGYFNEDFGAATYDDGLRMVATGEAAHYPMLTFAIGGDPAEPPRQPQRRRLLRPARPGRGEERPDRLDAGRALHPGRERARRGGEGLPRTSSPRSRAATSSPRRSARPVPTWSRAASCRPTCRRRSPTCCPTSRPKAPPRPALEFLSPVKGPALEQITVEVGSGIRPAADGAALYDQDVEKQAKQLGLPVGDDACSRRQSPPLTGRAAAGGAAMRRRSPYPYWFILPGAVVFAVLFLVPTVASFWFSLTRWDLFTATFIGLENFRQFFSEPFLLQGLVNTLIYAVVTSGIEDRARAPARGAADLRHLRAGLPAHRDLLPGARLVHRRRLHLQRADAPDPRRDQRRARGDRHRRPGLAHRPVARALLGGAGRSLEGRRARHADLHRRPRHHQPRLLRGGAHRRRDADRRCSGASPCRWCGRRP